MFNKELLLTEGSIFKALVKLSIPLILTNILQTAYNLIDTFWVGRLGKVAVAAVSLSFPIIFIIISLGSGLAVAGSILVAKRKGAQDMNAVSHISSQTFFIVLAVSIFLSIAGYWATPYLVAIMHAGPEVYTEAVSYLKISFLGLPFMFIFVTFQSIMRSLGEVYVPFYIVLATVLLNLIVDPLFIFGWKDWISGYGVSGAAIATVFTQFLGAVLALYFLLKGFRGVHIKLKDYRPDTKLIKEMFKLGLPVSIEQVSRSTGIFIMVMLVAQFGTLALASYGIGSRILSFIIIPAFGLGMATSTLVGQNIGAKTYDRVKKTLKLSLGIAFGVLSFFGLIFYVLAPEIACVFIPNDPETIKESAVFIKNLAVSFGFLGILIVLIGAFRGAGKTKISMLLAVFSVWILRFPLAYYLSFHTGLKIRGIWLSYPVTNILTALAGLLILIRYKWLTEIDENKAG